MPSSTSNSEVPTTMSKFDRPLPSRSLRGSAWIGFIIMIVLVGGWEKVWRDFGSVPSYRNSASLWATERRRIDNGEGDKTVFSGSSRMLFNAQPDVWEQESGQRPIQLSLEGTSPVGLMEDLAADDDFTGTLLVGVAPGLFFGGFEYRREAFDRYAKESPTQWLGQQISMLVEPYLAFYHYDFALFTILERQPFPARADVENPIDVRRLTVVEKDRATRMWEKLENDPEYAAMAQQIWAHGFEPYDELDEEEIEKNLESRSKEIERAVAATKALREKGAEVIFVRNPAEGHYAIREPTYNPRAETWDVLIEKTGALGIHWMDHEALQGFWLPEWSHIAGSEADDYTKALYAVIQQERELRNANSAE